MCPPIGKQINSDGNRLSDASAWWRFPVRAEGNKKNPVTPGFLRKKGEPWALFPEGVPAATLGWTAESGALSSTRSRTAKDGLRHLRAFLARNPVPASGLARLEGGLLCHRGLLGSQGAFQDSDEALQARARNLKAESTPNLQEQPSDRTIASFGPQVRPAQSDEVFHWESQFVARVSTFQYPDQPGGIALLPCLTPAPDRFGIDLETFAQRAQLDPRVVAPSQQEFESGFHPYSSCYGGRVGGALSTISMRSKS